MIPTEIFAFQRSAGPSQCFVCLDQGHRGKECAFLTAVFLDTQEGRSSLRESRQRVPQEVVNSVVERRVCLRYVLQFHWPLRETCVMARKLLFNILNEQMILDLGDYGDQGHSRMNSGTTQTMNTGHSGNSRMKLTLNVHRMVRIHLR
jgi:hypothetical protein